MQDLDSDKPEISFPDGTTMEGSYVDGLGSQLFFDIKPPADAEADGKNPPDELPDLTFLGLSEKSIRCSVKAPTDKPVPPPRVES